MLRIQSLSCRRGGREVFREVSFDVKAGDALLILGANGSGKSSLLRVISGLLPSVKGTIEYQGIDAAKNRDDFQRKLHYIGHLDAAKQELTVGEMSVYWQALQGASASEPLPADDPFGLRPLRDKPVRYLSAGQKRRLTLSRLLGNEAPLWLLDEPMTALDQQGQAILCACIDRHRAKGGIALIATHQDINLAAIASYTMDGRR